MQSTRPRVCNLDHYVLFGAAGAAPPLSPPSPKNAVPRGLRGSSSPSIRSRPPALPSKLEEIWSAVKTDGRTPPASCARLRLPVCGPDLTPTCDAWRFLGRFLRSLCLFRLLARFLCRVAEERLADGVADSVTKIVKRLGKSACRRPGAAFWRTAPAFLAHALVIAGLVIAPPGISRGGCCPRHSCNRTVRMHTLPEPGHSREEQKIHSGRR